MKTFQWSPILEGDPLTPWTSTLSQRKGRAPQPSIPWGGGSSTPTTTTMTMTTQTWLHKANSTYSRARPKHCLKESTSQLRWVVGSNTTSPHTWGRITFRIRVVASGVFLIPQKIDLGPVTLLSEHMTRQKSVRVLQDCDSADFHARRSWGCFFFFSTQVSKEKPFPRENLFCSAKNSKLR